MPSTAPRENLRNQCDAARYELVRRQSASVGGGITVEDYIRQAIMDAESCGGNALRAIGRGDAERAGLWAEAAVSYAHSALDMAHENGLALRFPDGRCAS